MPLRTKGARKPTEDHARAVEDRAQPVLWRTVHSPCYHSPCFICLFLIFLIFQFYLFPELSFQKFPLLSWLDMHVSSSAYDQ